MDIKDYFFKMKPLKVEAIIDDTTLRDGIQMPGLAAGPKDAAKIAQLLSEIGVERIEMFHYQEPDKKAAKLIMEQKLDMRVRVGAEPSEKTSTALLHVDLKKLESPTPSHSYISKPNGQKKLTSKSSLTL